MFDWVLNAPLESIYQLPGFDGNMSLKIGLKTFEKIFLPFKGLKTEHILRIIHIITS